MAATEIQLSSKSIKMICETLAPMVAKILTQSSERPLVNSKQMAKLLGISEATLGNWRNEGKINYIKTGDSKQSRCLYDPSQAIR